MRKNKCTFINLIPHNHLHTMTELEVNCSSPETIKSSFNYIAEKLFKDYQLRVNSSYYRLLDIEFYYHANDVHEDVYAHKHPTQLERGKWYFHASGIDITFGNGKNHGGILIRAIAKISNKGNKDKHFIEKEFHGPLIVKTELLSHFHGPFESEPNILQLVDISYDRMPALMQEPRHIIKTKRINLNITKDSDQNFHGAKLRYIIFPGLKLKDKTQIALDMQQQFPEMTTAEINTEIGSKFL